MAQLLRNPSIALDWPRRAAGKLAVRPALAHWWWRPLAVAVLSRVLILALAFVAGAIVPPAGEPVTGYHAFPGNIFLDTWASRWDTGFYLSIVTEGYVYPATPFSSVAFFPLYPLLIKALTLVGLAPVWAGIAVSNLAFLLATVLLYRLARLDWGHDTALRAVTYLAFFPMALFYSAVYTEALFLLLVVAAFFAARRGHWWLAGLIGALATATRLVGLILLPVLLAEFITQHPLTLQRRFPFVQRVQAGWRAYRSIMWLGLVPVGLLGYMVYLARRFGDPLAFQKASAAWGRGPRPFWHTVRELVQTTDWHLSAILGGAFPVQRVIDLLFVMFFLALAAWLLARGRPSYGLFVFLGALIPSSSGILMSMPRYVAVLFPAYLLLGQWGRRTWVDRLLLVVSALGLGMYVVLWANWYWVA